MFNFGIASAQIPIAANRMRRPWIALAPEKPSLTHLDADFYKASSMHSDYELQIGKLTQNKSSAISRAWEHKLKKTGLTRGSSP